MASQIKLYTRFRTPRIHDTTDTYGTSSTILSDQILTSGTKFCTNFRAPYTHDTTDTNNLVILDIDLTNLSIDIYQYQVKIFSKDEIDECTDYITSGITDVFLFISHITSNILLPLICDYEHLKSIYIFCKDQQCQICSNRKPKIRNIFDDINTMFERFEEQINTQKDDFYFEQKRSENSKQQEKEGIWWKFFYEILQHIHPTNVAKDEFIALSREHYANNQHILREIQEFEKDYTSDRAIHWYTRESFFYRMLNRTLQTQNLNNLFKLRLILIDLISGLNDAQSGSHHLIDYPLLVYRGSPLEIEEIHKMNSNVGSSIVVNSFLSTTIEKQVALMFTGDSLNNSSIQPVLFTIEIDSDIKTTPFANISRYSSCPEEKEFLFSISSTFCIQSVHLGKDNIWDIRLKFVGNLLDTDFGERSIFNPHVDQIFIRQLSQEKKQFTGFQLLLDMILRLDQSEYAKKELLQFCRLNYQNDSIELRKIDDFEENYRSEDAAKWYTKDSFLYRLLNESLRIEDIDSIVKMRYYIHDLHNQLAQLQPSFIQSLNGETNLTIYRGQPMKVSQLNDIRNNDGNFISMNSFVSATQNRKVAFIFSGDEEITNPDEVSVVYEMLIDTNIRSTPYAKIPSVMEDEEEILISMGPIFRVGEVEKIPDHNGVWNVKLKMVYIEDELWNELTAHLD